MCKCGTCYIDGGNIKEVKQYINGNTRIFDTKKTELELVAA